MLYNIITNEALNKDYAIPATEGGINDLAFENGWRIKIYNVAGMEVMNYLRDKHHTVIAYGPEIVLTDVKYVNELPYTYLSADEWNDLINTMYSDEDTLLLCDNPNSTPYVEDCGNSEEGDEDSWINDVLLGDDNDNQVLETELEAEQNQYDFIKDTADHIDHITSQMM